MTDRHAPARVYAARQRARVHAARQRARVHAARLRVRLARACLSVVLAVAATSAAAAGFVALDLEQRLAAADGIAVGVIRGVDVVVREGEPWTLVTMEVERWWLAGGQRVAEDAADGEEPGGDAPAGSAPGDTLTAAFWGGRAPGATPLQVAGVPTFGPGERVLWLLRAADDGLGAPTVGVTQGVWRWTAGAWIGDDGSGLGLDEDGDLALDGMAAPDAALFAALDAALDALEARP